MKTYNTIQGQNIFDVSIYLFGSIEGVYNLLANNKELSFETVLHAGDLLYYDDEYVIYSNISQSFSSNSIVPANGERTVYYKGQEQKPICIISQNANKNNVILKVSGTGVICTDWGDNSLIENIQLSSDVTIINHYFDNKVSGRRIIRLYGSFNIDVWDLSSVYGSVLPMRPMSVHSIYVGEDSSLELAGMALFKNTNSIHLSKVGISSLEAFYKMSISEIDIKDCIFENTSVLDDYFIYIAKNYNNRKYCKVTSNSIPSGEYKEPLKDTNGKYIINTGMEAIYVITHEDSWNEVGDWEFNINGVIYKHTNTNKA